MRTTFDIDDDILDALRPLAASRRQPLGSVIAELVRASMQARAGDAARNGFPVFQIASDAPLFGADEVARALDEWSHCST